MGFFDFLKQANINQGIEEYKKTAGAVLLDVRTPQELRELLCSGAIRGYQFKDKIPFAHSIIMI